MLKITKDSTPFDRKDYDAFAGTTPFADGTPPMSFIVEKDETSIYVLAGDNGVEVVISDTNSDDTVSLFNNDFDEDKFRTYIPDFSRKNAILSTYSRIVQVIKDSLEKDGDIYKLLLYNLDGFSLALG